MSDSPDPRIIPVRAGFLAVSPDGVRPRIGITAPTEPEARLAFAQAFQTWLDLIALAEYDAAEDPGAV